MSLVLRKGCQPLLDKSGLDMLHVGIINKTLTLQGTCGKSIVSVNGIQFNSKTITKAELEYAVELFSTFLNKHESDLKDYITKAKAFSQVEMPRPEDFGAKKNSYHGTYSAEIEVNGYKYTVSITPTHTSFGSIRHNDYTEVVKQIAKLKDKADEYYKVKAKYDKLNLENQKLLTAIVVCDI